ncbi:MAG: O-acetylhomoserine aminocarboxypropyltransferase/cysteine synthase [Oscillospiraceae bacterium]|nr:O-acetylhomoserine aminocarboxypropyltransferase/cysteine synthase [Oscillospiraceae bacterium]
MTPSVDTVCVQGGYRPGNGEPRQVPIVQSTTFKYDTGSDMAKLFDLEASGYFYSRLQNPTCDTVAAKICAMEGGSAAMLTSSGMAASFFAAFNLVSCGDHMISCSAIYGGTFNLFAYTMKRMGVEVTFVSPDCSRQELDAAFRPNTKLVFGETIANPALRMLDFEKFSSAAHAHGVPLIVDNTFATPVNCRPFEHGADIVVHSTTKYMDGHGYAVGGAIVDSGRFDWTAHPEKFPGLCTPDETYHGITYTERFGLEGAYITKATAQLMRDLGATPSPQSAFLLNLGLESLHVRMKRHCETAQKLASFLSQHPLVSWVRYPGLPGDVDYELCRKYLPKGSCGVISFGVKGGRAAAEAFQRGLSLAAIETHVADARTCCLHPASTTHRQMYDQELLAAGVSADLIRLSCGLEDPEDLMADLDQALRRSQQEG